MANILLVSGHPDLNHSLANKTILAKMEEFDFPFTLRRMDLLGWDFDIAREQEYVKQADVIVFQFPLYWYSFPAIIKNWVEKVFAHGFAYGSTGNALKGKHLLLSFTVGGGADHYRKDGQNRHPIEEFLYSFEQMASLCQMKYEKPIYSFGMAYIPGVSSEEDRNQVTDLSISHAERLMDALRSLQEKTAH